MNYKTLNIIAVLGLLISGSGIFAAGATVVVDGGTARSMPVEFLTTDSRRHTIFVSTGSPVKIDFFLAGIEEITWVDCGTLYKARLTPRVEGLEGWREWKIRPRGVLYGSAFGLNAPYGPLQAEVVKAGRCRCAITAADVTAAR